MKTRLFVGLLVVAMLSASAHAANFMEIVLARLDDPLNPFTHYTGSVFVGLDNPATSVTIDLPSGQVIHLDQDSPGGTDWSAYGEFANLPDLIGDIDGSWLVNVLGSNPGTLAFDLNAAAITATDFFDTPDILQPTHGSSVQGDTHFVWTTPDGATSDDLGFVGVTSQFFFADEQFPIGTESWDPPFILPAGTYDFSVSYYRLADDSLISNVQATGLTWGNSDFAPEGWPVGTPLLVLGAESIARFSVVPEPAAISLMALGALALVSRRRR
jgi:hypothetical protein